MNDERLGLPSASSWRRFELCQGSYQLGLKAQELDQVAHKEGAAAAEGTRIHAWLAGEPGIKLSASEAETAEFLLERATEQRVRIFGETEVSELKEKRLWLEVNGRPLLSARFDRVLYTQRLALVQDYKTGWSEPDPAELNAQLKVEAVLVALNLPTATEVVVQIISGPYGVTEARYTMAQLASAYNEVIATLKALQEPDAPLRPSPEACRYCPANLICERVKELVGPLVKTQAAALPEGGERAAKLLDEVAVLRRHLEEIEEFYESRLLADPTYDIPGYALVPGTVRREVTDWDTARARLEEYLDVSELKGAASYRLGELEKALGRKLSLKGPAIKERMNQILNGLLEEKQNKPSLKRIKGEPKLRELESV